MSILWMDDPNFYATAQLQQRYDNSPNASVLVGSGGRFSNNCWQFSSAFVLLQKNVAAIQTGTLGLSVNISSLAISRQIMAFQDTGSIQCDLRLDTLGHLIVTRNGTTLATSTNALSLNVWYRIEFKLKVDPTVGTIEVRVNGSSTGWIPSTGSLNTRATTNSTFNQINIGFSGTGIAMNANDFVYTDSNSPNADFLGDVRCYLRMPSADSSITWTATFAAFLNSHAYVLGESFKDSNGNVQRTTTAGTSASSGTPTWATAGGSTTTSNTATFTVVGSGTNPGAHNWMAVNEPFEDGDSSYNSSSTPGQIDLFSLPSLPAGANGVLAVDNILFSRKDDAGVRTIQSQISSGGTTSNSASQTMSTTYQFIDEIAEKDPHTSAAWTVAAANSMLVGYDEIA